MLAEDQKTLKFLIMRTTKPQIKILTSFSRKKRVKTDNNLLENTRLREMKISSYGTRKSVVSF